MTCGELDTIKVLEKLCESNADDGDGRPLSTIAQESIDSIRGRLADH
ncbi:MAG: hypothetical protein QGG36_01325 [Pirellulaceae bacterium]|jgi:hypothetical protein|nr:hypothetical protein [Pirellulaceae bacterium]